ncbi:MAG: anthranilate synthase component I [Candidatus Omnitrophica bacterium]|nr:anthranilate synthase component I [Candidatus Omnitrophota bacterium]MCM8826824.1 anthranilate synthase component I [Candidatus Omnitrophota bacterium]
MEVIPCLKDFLKVSSKKNLIVFSYKFFCDYLTPLSIYSRIKKIYKEDTFLLESVEGEEKISRFSFIGFQPLAIFKSKDRNIYINIDKEKKEFITNYHPLYELKKFMSNFRIWPKENIRFFGGFVGYLGYDVIKFYEPVGNLKKEDDYFDSYFILPRFLIIFDHLKKQIELLSFLYLKEKDNLVYRHRKEVEEIKKVINYIIVPQNLPLLYIPSSEREINSLLRKISFKSNFKKKDFISAVVKAKDYINQGEAIQIVLSQRFQLPFTGDPFLVYRYLRLLNPSPYMFYLNFTDIDIVGSSPEMLLRCEKRLLITRPIAGTRRRGNTEDEDLALENELLDDPKERAEHTMLVDLGRNDLGRVAEKGTVKVPIFMKIERFSHVMHIVSEVQGMLDKRKDMFDALCSCFPAGTVTGAPKVRAMQIINELEPSSRGIYAGCIGYFSFTNSLDTCIIIRTLIFKDNYAYIQAGAGIVVDSKPQNEYKETINKAKAQLIALILAGCVSTS